MFILYGAKAQQAKGKILSTESLGLKLLAKLKLDIYEIWRNCFGTYKMAHFTATIWHTASSDIKSNKTDTTNFIFSANLTQKYLVEIFRYVKAQHH